MTVDGLRLTPFRGLRYDPERVNGLGSVMSPPYDVVVRPDGLHHLETADPYNIVRLILPQAADPADRHQQAAGTLRRWREEGVLTTDRQPAVYVYEQRRGATLQRGLIGALRLPPAGSGVVLPHEDVIPEVVADRAELARTMAAQPEPLLLSYRGNGTGDGAAGVIEHTVQLSPLLETVTEDGFQHRLWAVTDPDQLAAVDADLARRRALIADGHHRWATYLRLRDEHAGTASTQPGAGAPEPNGAPNTTDSPWNYGLVLLVDTSRYPLQVQAIHRVLPRVTLQRALEQVRAQHAFRVQELHTTLPDALAALERCAGNAFLLTEGNGTFQLLDRPAPQLLERTVDRERPTAWRELDATVLHAALLDEVLGVPDHPYDIGYIHDARAAVTQAAEHGGTAVLMRAVREETVRELAERGITMPRKSTSFGPKPATGVVLRTLED